MDSRRPIKVLMIIPNLRVSNGVTSFVMNYYRNIDHDQIKVDFAVLSHRDSPYEKEVTELGSKVFVLPSLIKHPFRHVAKCKEIISNGKYYVVHDNSLNQTIPLMKQAKKSVPVRILHSHSARLGETGGKEFINKMFVPSLVRTANFLSACSSNAGNALFGRKEFKVIPNIIDTDLFRFDNAVRDSVRSRENAGGKKIIGTVGRLADLKNPFFAVDVMEEVLRSCSDAEYWWIGSGPLDSKVQEYVAQKNLSDRIRLFGSREDTKELYQAMDLFFLPSKSEGFGLACIEAEASGLPCVVSSEFPVEVDITGDVTFIPLAEDIKSWADEILRLIDKDTDRVHANEICSRSPFSVSGSGSILSDYYRECLAVGVG